MKKSLADWLSYLENLHPSEIELGLTRVRRVAQSLDVLTFSCPVVSISGTNGKGSSVASFEALARQTDKKIASFTSPHLLFYNERIRINGEAVSDVQLIQSFEAVEVARGETSLTYFEFGTLAALWLFKQEADLELVVLEIGLGGRLDSVNIVDADIAIVTSIALDHQDWLGSDRETIAREKAGIFRAGAIAICGDRNPPLSLKETADNLSSTWLAIGETFDAWRSNQGLANESWTYRGRCFDLLLPASYLVIENMACVLQAWECLGFETEPAVAAFTDIRIAGRLQQLPWSGKTVLLDVAHNPAAAEHLALRLPDILQGRSCVAVFAALADKDVLGVVAPLKEEVAEWHLAGLSDLPRAQSASALENKLQGLIECNSTHRSVAEALQFLAESEAEVILVFGSFYTVAQALNTIQQ